MDLTGPRIIDDPQGRKIVPSVVSLLPDGKSSPANLRANCC